MTWFSSVFCLNIPSVSVRYPFPAMMSMLSNCVFLISSFVVYTPPYKRCFSKSSDIPTPSGSYFPNVRLVSPCGSPSTIRTLFPNSSARIYAIESAVVVFPIPPFGLMTEIIACILFPPLLPCYYFLSTCTSAF